MQDDTALSEWVNAARRADVSIEPVRLVAGDLARTAGGGGAGRFDGDVAFVPVDLIRVESPERVDWCVSHVVARRSWWRGQVRMAMNAQFLDGRDVAPRGHPNDGRMDLVEIDSSMPVRQRLIAARRARTGSYLPHPSIRTRSSGEVTWMCERPTSIYVDGRRWTMSGQVRLVVEPDAFWLYV